jgi:hypothetical protein
MRIDQDGNVGINQTTPTHKLHVVGDIKLQNSQIQLTNGYGLMWGTTGLYAYADTNYIRFDVGGSQAMRIISSGNVGIGTSAPDGALDVDGGIAQIRSVNDNALKITQNAANTYPANLSLTKSRGSYASPANVANDDLIGRINTTAYSGSQYWSTASIDFEVHGTVTDNTRPPSKIVFYTNASNASTAARMTIANAGTVNVVGTFTAGTKTFQIPHPLPELNDTNYLIHGCLEGPRLDLIYRGVVTLVAGSATVDLDEAAGMTAGTWALLCRDAQVFSSNETGWYHVRGTVSGSTLTIECEEGTCDDTVSWMVVAERQDDEIRAQSSTDDEGHLMIEPLQVEPPSTSASPSE